MSTLSLGGKFECCAGAFAAAAVVAAAGFGAGVPALASGGSSAGPLAPAACTCAAVGMLMLVASGCAAGDRVVSLVEGGCDAGGVAVDADGSEVDVEGELVAGALCAALNEAMHSSAIRRNGGILRA